jgi:hypothetical protein
MVLVPSPSCWFTGTFYNYHAATSKMIRMIGNHSITVLFLAYFIVLKICSYHSTRSCYAFGIKLESRGSRGIPRWLQPKRSTTSTDSSVETLQPHNGTFTQTFSTVKTDEITDIIVHKVKESMSHTGTMASIQMIIEQFLRQMERVSERTIERATERTMERVGKRSVERAAERSLERVGERTFELIAERSVEQFGERTVERAGTRVLDRVGERVFERASERTLNQVGKKALIKQSNKKAILTLINRFKTPMMGKSLTRGTIRICRGLTIALPVLGGLFALYLFLSDIQRWQEEYRKQQQTIDNKISCRSTEQKNILSVALATLILFVGAGVTDLFDAIIHFRIAYGLLVSHHSAFSHHLMEQISFYCAIVSTLLTIGGEACSYLVNNKKGREANLNHKL